MTPTPLLHYSYGVEISENSLECSIFSVKIRDVNHIEGGAKKGAEKCISLVMYENFESMLLFT